MQKAHWKILLYNCYKSIIFQYFIALKIYAFSTIPHGTFYYQLFYYIYFLEVGTPIF